MKSHAKKITALYRRHAQAWVTRRGSSLSERSWLEKMEDLLPQYASMLDIGCGSGVPIARYLIEKEYKVTGIDASPELIGMARERFEGSEWITSDMRSLNLNEEFDGILAWNSLFHLTPNDQRKMFAIFRKHSARGAALMFTSGPCHGETIGKFEGENLYHASLDGTEYRELLSRNSFEIVDQINEDPDCGFHTVWLARFSGDS